MDKKKRINKKTLIKNLDNECMKLWHGIVFKRDGGKCILCGKKEHIQIHHVYTRKAHFAVKHDTNNGVCLCSGCHGVKVHMQATPDLGIYLLTLHGQEWFDALKLQANQIVNDKLEHLERMKEYLLGEKLK